MNWSTLCLLLLFTLLSGLDTYGQYRITAHYTTTDGLPSNETYSITQDHKGYLWIATDRGLVRFNGSQFKTYGYEQGLRSTVVLKLIPHPVNGLLFYDLNNRIGKLEYNRFHYISLPDSTASIATISKGEKGMIIAYRNRTKYTVLPWDNTLPITKDCATNHFLITNIGQQAVCMGHPENEEKVRTVIYNTDTFYQPDFLMQNNMAHTYQVVHDSALYVVAPTTVSTFSTTNGMQTVSFKGNPSGGGLIDTEKRLWIGLLNQGLKVLTLPQLTPLQSMLQGHSVSSIYEDYEGGIWVTTLNHGVYRLVKTKYQTISNALVHKMQIDSNRLYATIDNTSMLIHDLVHSTSRVTELKHKIVDFSTCKQQLFIQQDRVVNYITPPLKAQFITLENAPIGFLKGAPFGVARNRLHYYTSKGRNTINIPGLTNDHSYVNKSNGDSLYIGKSSGLYLVRPQYEQYPAKKILEYPVHSIQTASKHLIIGTNGHGIVILDQEHRIVKRFNNLSGLNGDYISDLSFFNDTLLIGNNRGINVIVQPFSDQSIIYSSGTAQGLFSDAVLNIGKFKDRVYVATRIGIQSTSMATICQPAENPRIVLLTVNGIPVNDLSNIQLDPGTQKIQLDFELVAPTPRQHTFTQYRLLSLDSTWITLQGTLLNFSNLSPGVHLLQIRSKLPENSDFNQVQIHLTILPHFTQTVWFKTVVLLLILALILGFFLFRERMIRSKNQRRIEQEELKYKMLTSQLNPHFLFNALGSIQSLIIQQKTKLAAEYLATFSGLIDRILRLSETLYIPLQDEIDFINDYVGVEKNRFKVPFEFHWNIASDLDKLNILVPTFFLQPFIENSIKHGIIPLKKAGKISVTIKKCNPQTLSIVIRDNGIGYETSLKRKKNSNTSNQRPSLAIRNIQNRLHTMSNLFGPNLTQSIHELKNETGHSCGTEVWLEIPYQIQENENIYPGR